MTFKVLLKIEKERSFVYLCLLANPQIRLKERERASKDNMDLQLMKIQGRGESSVWLLSTQPEHICREHREKTPVQTTS